MLGNNKKITSGSKKEVWAEMLKDGVCTHNEISLIFTTFTSTKTCFVTRHNCDVIIELFG